ncbi:hypothetical protein MSG28_000213 [Choristoneura fumiferana]|uniref:Uncharacterized protein n=1 Tax=Choristoneura fumiferana TaxID=7141 RepID=A0ACC0JZQ4_CHOFU|nr:hypothetical protein MSG28_000213 [Choristoneura fumiferana]
MLGGVGGRHASARRRGSTPGVRRVESPLSSPLPPRRRRAALASTDHKTCALIHTRLKFGDIMMLGGVGGRHASARRRGSTPGVRRVESPLSSPLPPRRRRAALASTDHKTCALIHTRLKFGDIM